MFNLLKSGYSKLKKALSRTRSVLGDQLRNLLGKGINEETLEEIERILYEADLGSKLVEDFIKEIKSFGKEHPEAGSDKILLHLENFAKDLLEKPIPLTANAPISDEPLVILLVGVNGTGKTTSAAKLAKKYQDQGKKVLLAAGDTFRAAATEQLEVWAGRLGLDIVKGLPKGDPSSVLHDAISSALAKGYDVVIADTAGRLESKTDLMHQLAKMRRVCQKLVPSAPHETLLVLDATTGQNALDQTKIFHEFTPLTGIVLTKVDGSAKGGIALAIYNEMGIPIRYMGIGEGVDDLAPFESKTYIEALFAR